MCRAVMSVMSVLVAAVVVVAPRPAAAVSRPDAIRFDLQDGNFIVGYSYEPPRSRSLPVVVMIHGASDSHTVFDFTPGFRAAPELALLGFPVLTLDRVGYGASSRPNGDTLTFAASAGYVHEVIQAVRGG